MILLKFKTLSSNFAMKKKNPNLIGSFENDGIRRGKCILPFSYNLSQEDV